MKPLSITFLGTCSGGGPLISRACTATALNLDSSSWLVDCAEGTQTQILRTGHMRLGRIDKIFVTHMHVDHIMGIIPLLRSAMYHESYTPLRLQLYGPPGLRSFVRFNLSITEVSLSGKYTVHELLQKGEMPSVTCSQDQLHENEVPGMDLIASDDGLWRDVASQGNWSVDAGPVAHRTRCFGYVFREKATSSIGGEAFLNDIDRNERVLIEQGVRYPRGLLKALLKDRKPVELPDGTVLEPPPLDIPGRKIVILGDTSDPSPMIPIAMDASALVHEATNAFIPPEISAKVKGLGNGKGAKESVRTRAMGRGHSTADMAGSFARTIRARRLFLNHFSTKFAPGGQSPVKSSHGSKRRGSPNTIARQEEAGIIMAEIEKQASEAWSMGRAIAATDLLTVNIPQHEAAVPLSEKKDDSQRPKVEGLERPELVTEVKVQEAMVLATVKENGTE